MNPSHSRINALSYQLDFVNYALRRLYEEGAVRLLLADDVGLGKTVMTGLLIKEMMLRGLARRILVVTPRFLTFQWRRELAEKFDIYCAEKDPRADCVVVSVDYLKRHLEEYAEKEWDLAVFDEAHNLTVGAGAPTRRYAASNAQSTPRRRAEEGGDADPPRPREPIRAPRERRESRKGARASSASSAESSV